MSERIKKGKDVLCVSGDIGLSEEEMKRRGIFTQRERALIRRKLDMAGNCERQINDMRGTAKKSISENPVTAKTGHREQTAERKKNNNKLFEL